MGTGNNNNESNNNNSYYNSNIFYEKNEKLASEKNISNSDAGCEEIYSSQSRSGSYNHQAVYICNSNGPCCVRRV